MAMQEPRTTGLVLADLFDFPDDGVKRELIGGVLYVSPSPRLRHQLVVARLTQYFMNHTDEHGGVVYPGANVDPAVGDHVEPDVVALRAGYDGPMDDLSILGPPDLLVEVSSPSTKRYDLMKKRPLYERHRVPELWLVDLDHDVVLEHRLRGDHTYGDPAILGVGDELTATVFPGLRIAVRDLLA